MAVPIALFALAALAVAAWASGDKKSGTAPGGTLGVGGPQDWYETTPTGVIVARKEKVPLLLASLSDKACNMATGLAGVPALTVVVGPGGTGMPALAWLTSQTAAGRLVLASLNPARPWMASVAPGEELTWASASRREWAVLAEPGSTAAGLPTTPATGPGAGSVTLPGGWTVPIPTMPGPTVPASTTPGKPTGPQIELPGGITIPIPTAPPAPPPAPPPPAPSPQPPSPPAPGLPSVPGFPSGVPGFPSGVPGFPSVPGVPGTTTPGPVGTAQVETPTGPWPATHVHKVRAGDIPSKIAQHYTGDFLRANELVPLNNLTVQGSGPNTYFTPWKVGQLVKLPLDWPVVAKGLPPLSAAALLTYTRTGKTKGSASQQKKGGQVA